ncbi:amidohydrolase family protein [Nocardia jiangxiensis]|uniref:amidohydrolase family protein n=1 Tax=Nocardia jiangxiensis TaxID=282685 RepID=UPI00030FE740|nr:amidohydrolase family protein [Nocardia jiangxiensis]
MADTPGKIVIFSADGHAGAKRMKDYLPYFARDVRDTVADLLVEEERAYRRMIAPDFTSRPAEQKPEGSERLWSPAAPERFGGWDIAVRMEQLNREGVAGELLVPGHQFSSLPLFSVVNKPFEADLRTAGVHAYHRWLADFMAGGDGRLHGMADPGPCHDIDAAVRELRWAREHGFVSVGVPGIIEDPSLPSLLSDHYEPFWQACADLDMTLMVHAGWGFPQGRYQEFISAFVTTHLGEQEATQMLAAQQHLDEEARAALQKEFAESPASPFRLDFGPRRLLWQLMLAGVFDRYPSLRFVLAEVRSDWVPATLQLLDSWYEQRTTPLKMRPSEYWARHCFATPSSIHKAEVEAREAVGVERLMLGIDYPHPEGMWPDTWDWIRVAFDGVPESEARLILGENALRAFPVDAAHIRAVAERIGPDPSRLLSDREDVPAGHIEHFHRRSGFLRPAERVDTDATLELADEDLRLVG